MDITTNRPITDEAHSVGLKRSKILKLARPLLADGKLPLRLIAERCGVSKGQLCKLRDRFAHLQDHELTPENLAGNFANCGRESDYEELAQQETIRQCLKRIFYTTTGASSDAMTIGRRTGSVALTLEMFGSHELCPESLRHELLSGKKPAPLVRVIREITPEMEQRNRGHKHMSLHGTFRCSREMIEKMEDGERREIQPGDWWVFDDMSANTPHWFIGPDGSPMVGRQGLYAYDITHKWLGLEKVCTIRDSYTAAIILRFVRRLMEQLGKPRRGIVFEQSVWKARSIAGFRLTSGGDMIEEEFEREAMSEEEQAKIHQGLEALGLIIYYTATPRGKEIEGGFRYLQKVTSVFAGLAGEKAGHQIVNIGAHRGEFEAAAKAMRRAHAKSHHPEDLGFLHVAESADLETKAMEWIDNRKAGRKETDQARYDRSIELNPPQPLSERDMAVFLPSIHELEIRGGKVWPTVDGDTYEFTHPELFASLGAGYRLYVRFDPTEPTRGAAIYNREMSTANHQGWQDGQFMAWADYVAPVARFDWSDEDNATNDLKRRFNKFVRTEFRIAGMPKAKATTARDGRGRVVEITRTPSETTPRTTTATEAPKQRIHDPAKTRERQLQDLADDALANVKE